METNVEWTLNLKNEDRNKLVDYPNGVKAYRFETLNDQKVASLFTTRIGGVSQGFYASMNMGPSTGDDPVLILENCRRMAECMGTTLERMVAGAQTHTRNIRIVTEADAGKGVTLPKDYQDIDGLITNVRGLCLYTTHADCNPVLFYDPVRGVVAAIHSGWMGTLLNISAEAVRLMTSEFASNPADIKMAIGPALCQDCFEVDWDVAEKFLKAYSYLKVEQTIPDRKEKENPVEGHSLGIGREASLLYQKGNKYYIDLKGIIVREVAALGVKQENMEIASLCTKELPQLFHSHRRSGKQRGLMASAIMLR